jgi:hypothetical protein
VLGGGGTYEYNDLLCLLCRAMSKRKRSSESDDWKDAVPCCRICRQTCTYCMVAYRPMSPLEDPDDDDDDPQMGICAQCSKVDVEVQQPCGGACHRWLCQECVYRNRVEFQLPADIAYCRICAMAARSREDGMPAVVVPPVAAVGSPTTVVVPPVAAVGSPTSPTMPDLCDSDDPDNLVTRMPFPIGHTHAGIDDWASRQGPGRG